MMTVSQILETKGRAVWSVPPETPLLDALRQMAEKSIGALLVVEDEKLVGIFSERDYIGAVALQGDSLLNTPVRDLMTAEVIYVCPQITIEDCMQLMMAWHLRHLPVIEHAQLAGMISMRDVVEATLAEKELAIGQLKLNIRELHLDMETMEFY